MFSAQRGDIASKETPTREPNARTSQATSSGNSLTSPPACNSCAHIYLGYYRPRGWAVTQKCALNGMQKRRLIFIITKKPILGVSGVLDVLVLLETARFTSHCLLVLYIIYAW